MAKLFSGTFAKRNKALFVTGYRTGFRISELLSLTVDDVLQHVKIIDHLTLQRAMGQANLNSTVQHLSFREDEIDAAIFAA